MEKKSPIFLKIRAALGVNVKASPILFFSSSKRIFPEVLNFL